MKVKFRELKEKPAGELEKLLMEKRERLRSLRFAVSAAQHSKVRDIRAARKTIARILTLLGRTERK